MMVSGLRGILSQTQCPVPRRLYPRRKKCIILINIEEYLTKKRYFNISHQPLG
jgi:hypothetical protein